MIICWVMKKIRAALSLVYWYLKDHDYNVLLMLLPKIETTYRKPIIPINTDNDKKK